MTPIAEPTTDEDFEAEVRAMLARRAGDVSPSPAPPGRRRRGLASVDAPRGRPAGRPAGRRPPPASCWRPARPPTVAHEPAGPSTTTSAAPEARTRSCGRSTTTSPPTSSPPRRRRRLPTWPRWSADVAVPRPLEAPVVDADRATVGYRLGDIPGHVGLRLDGPVGRRGRVERCGAHRRASVADGRVEAMTVLGDAVETDMVLRASTVGRLGQRDGAQLHRRWSSWRPRTACSSSRPRIGDDPGAPPRRPRGSVHRRRAAAGGLVASAAVRVDVLAPDDGDPATPEVVVGHATHAVDGPGAEDEPDPPTTSTIVDPEPEVDTDENVVDGPGEETPADVVPPSGATAGGIHVEGTYRGDERFGSTAGDCPDLDHELHSTFTLTDGRPGRSRPPTAATSTETSGAVTGPFTFTTPGGDTITGTLTTAATLPTEGVPYDLAITGGTGAYAGATGACRSTTTSSPRRRSALSVSRALSPATSGARPRPHLEVEGTWASARGDLAGEVDRAHLDRAPCRSRAWRRGSCVRA